MARLPQYGPVLSRGQKYRVRMRMNTDPALLAVADGMGVAAQKIVDSANVPDATPLGLGLIQGGGVAVWALGKRVDHNADIKSPRNVKPAKDGVVAVAGFGFPGRLLELGTVNMRARPFLGPSAIGVADEIPSIVRDNFPRGS